VIISSVKSVKWAVEHLATPDGSLMSCHVTLTRNALKSHNTIQSHIITWHFACLSCDIKKPLLLFACLYESCILATHLANVAAQTISYLCIRNDHLSTINGSLLMHFTQVDTIPFRLPVLYNLTNSTELHSVQIYTWGGVKTTGSSFCSRSL